MLLPKKSHDLISGLLSEMERQLNKPCSGGTSLPSASQTTPVDSDRFNEPPKAANFDGRRLLSRLAACPLCLFTSPDANDGREMVHLLHELAMQRTIATGERALFVTGWAEEDHHAWLISLGIDVDVVRLKRGQMYDAQWQRLTNLLASDNFDKHAILKVKPFITINDLKQVIVDISCTEPLGLVVIDPVYVCVEVATKGYWSVFEDLTELAKCHQLSIWCHTLFDSSDDGVTPENGVSYEGLLDELPSKDSIALRLDLSNERREGRVPSVLNVTSKIRGKEVVTNIDLLYDYDEFRILGNPKEESRLY
jgi:hypothetical protein